MCLLFTIALKNLKSPKNILLRISLWSCADFNPVEFGHIKRSAKEIFRSLARAALINQWKKFDASQLWDQLAFDFLARMP